MRLQRDSAGATDAIVPAGQPDPPAMPAPLATPPAAPDSSADSGKSSPKPSRDSSTESTPNSSKARRQGKAAPASGPIDSVVVLPFTNASGSPDHEYLSDGITDSLINSLSKLGKILVVPRSLAFSFKGKVTDPEGRGKDAPRARSTAAASSSIPGLNRSRTNSTSRPTADTTKRSPRPDASSR